VSVYFVLEYIGQLSTSWDCGIKFASFICCDYVLEGCTDFSVTKISIQY